MEEENVDVYKETDLTEYDWEIGGEEIEDDDEEAEIEAARLGKLSNFKACAKSKAKINNSKIIDGWTAPSIKKG